jgi:hypothetical protein
MQLSLAQRGADRVFFAEPLAQIDKLAAPRAKGAVATSQPIAFPLARRALNLPKPFHATTIYTLLH